MATNAPKWLKTELKTEPTTSAEDRKGEAMATNAPKRIKTELKTEPTTSAEDTKILDEFSRALEKARDSAECYLWSTPGMYIMPPALQQMKDESTLTDVTLLVGPDKVTMAAHRLMLAAFSDHFREAFSAAPVNQHVNVVDFADPDSMKMVLDYFYTGQPVALTRENAPRILILSNRLRSSDLEMECANFIRKFINEKNCVKLLQLAHQLDLEHLLNESALFVVANLEKVVASNFDFVELSVDIVLQMIAHPAAVISEKSPAENEKQLFMLVWKGIGLLPEEERRKAIPKLLGAIHLPQVDKEFLDYIVEKVGDIPEANDLLKKARQPIKPAEINYWYLPRYKTKGTVKVASNPEHLAVNDVETYVYTPTILIKGYPWLVYVEKTEDTNIFHLESGCVDTEPIESLGLPGKIVAQASYKATKKGAGENKATKQGAGENFTIGPNIYHKYTAQKNPAVASVPSCENLKLTITVNFEADSGSSALADPGFPLRGGSRP